MRITSRIVLSCLLVVAALAGFPADAHANTTQSSRLAVGAWYSSCYLDAGGGLWCWGSNDSGDIGDGTKIRANAPVQVPGLSSGVKSIALGEGHGCAVNSAGGVVCWGFNQYGEPVVLEGSELLARCIQHETDHLDGILFIDRLSREQRKQAMKAIREAEWAGGPTPVVKLSPHSTFGKGL